MFRYKVSSMSDPGSVAGALAGGIRVAQEATLVSIGAGALNQAVKGVVIAREFLRTYGIEICVKPSFSFVEINGERKTTIELLVFDESSQEMKKAG